MRKCNPYIDAQYDFSQVLDYSLNNDLKLGLISVDIQSGFLKNLDKTNISPDYLVEYHKTMLKLSEEGLVPNFVFSHHNPIYGENLLSDNPYLKPGNSCFDRTNLENLLVEQNVDLTFIIGVFSESCVFETMVDGKHSNSKFEICTSLRGVERQKLLPHMLYQTSQTQIIKDFDRVCKLVLK